jgi:hypothetical protein
MRYTEQELRDFLAEQAQLWLEEAMSSDSQTTKDEIAYAYGAREAYLFVTRFMDEYKLEEVTS